MGGGSRSVINGFKGGARRFTFLRSKNIVFEADLLVGGGSITILNGFKGGARKLIF